jgi:carbamoyltransferase
MNLKIKYRESFRPFAPAIKAERVSEWFEIDRSSPYMLLVAPVREEKRLPVTEEQKLLFGVDKLHTARSQIPAVTHVDYSARVQTVHRETNPRFYDLISHFEKRTGCPLLINTSFNVRGEPIVCTPEDAYRCFMRTEMDYLVMENILLAKQDQAKREQDASWKQEFDLD